MFKSKKHFLGLAILASMSPTGAYAQNNIEGSIQNRDSTTSIGDMNLNLGIACVAGMTWDPLSFRCRSIPPSCFTRDETRAASCPAGFTGSRTERFMADCPEGPYGALRTLINWNLIDDSCVPIPPPPVVTTGGTTVTNTTPVTNPTGVVEVDANAVCGRVGNNNWGGQVAYCAVANSHRGRIEEWHLPKNGWGVAWAAQYVCQEYGFRYAIEMSYGAGNTSRNTLQAWYIYPNNAQAGNEGGWQAPMVAPHGVVALARLWCSDDPNASRPPDCNPVNFPEVTIRTKTAVIPGYVDEGGNAVPGTVCSEAPYEEMVTISGGESGDTSYMATFCNVNTVIPAHSSPGLFSGEGAFVELSNQVCFCSGNTTTCGPAPPVENYSQG